MKLHVQIESKTILAGLAGSTTQNPSVVKQNNEKK